MKIYRFNVTYSCYSSPTLRYIYSKIFIKRIRMYLSDQARSPWD